MTFYITYKSRADGCTISEVYKVRSVTTDGTFINFTDEQGNFFGFPMKNIIRVRVENEEVRK